MMEALAPYADLITLVIVGLCVLAAIGVIE